MGPPQELQVHLQKLLWRPGRVPEHNSEGFNGRIDASWHSKTRTVFGVPPLHHPAAAPFSHAVLVRPAGADAAKHYNTVK